MPAQLHVVQYVYCGEGGETQIKEKGKKKQPKKDPILEREGKSVRTCMHGRHFPDLPFGEIAIEGTSFTKHCITATAKKSPRIKIGLKKKGREHCSTIELVLPHATERRRGKEAAKKKTRSWRGEKVYVLEVMVVTFPTCQVEISPLKALARVNTAPQQQQRKVQG